MSSRKEFLLAGAFASFAPANALASAPPAPQHAAEKPTSDGTIPQDAPHRQCFGATKLGSDVLLQMYNSLNAYEEFYGERLHAVGVLYHGPAIGLAFNDTVWNEVLIPALPYLEKKGIKSSVQPKPGKGNPYYHATKGEKTNDDCCVENLVKRGAHFFVCNNATVGLALDAAKALNMTPPPESWQSMRRRPPSLPICNQAFRKAP